MGIHGLPQQVLTFDRSVVGDGLADVFFWDENWQKMTIKEHQKWRCTAILRIYMDIYGFIYTIQTYLGFIYIYIPSKLGKMSQQKMKDVTNTMRIWLTREQGCHLWRIDSTNNLEYHPTDRHWLVTTASYNMLQPIYWWDNLHCSAQDLCAATGFVAQMDSKMEKEQDVNGAKSS